MKTDWHLLLGRRLYDQTQKSRLKNMTPDLYFSTRSYLVRLATLGIPLSSSEYPFAVDNTESNDVVLVDLTSAYLLAHRACERASAESPSNETAALIRQARGAITFIQQNEWRLSQEETFLPPCLHTKHLEALQGRLRSLFVCGFVRGRLEAKKPATTTENIAYLLSCMLVVSDAEIDDCGQRPYVNMLACLWISRMYAEDPSNPDIAQCFQCYGDKAKGFQRVVAREEDILRTTFTGRSLPRHTSGPHVEIRALCRPNATMSSIADKPVEPFDPSVPSTLWTEQAPLTIVVD